MKKTTIIISTELCDDSIETSVNYKDGDKPSAGELISTLLCTLDGLCEKFDDKEVGKIALRGTVQFYPSLKEMLFEPVKPKHKAPKTIEINGTSYDLEPDYDIVPMSKNTVNLVCVKCGHRASCTAVDDDPT